MCVSATAPAIVSASPPWPPPHSRVLIPVCSFPCAHFRHASPASSPLASPCRPPPAPLVCAAVRNCVRSACDTRSRLALVARRAARACHVSARHSSSPPASPAVRAIPVALRLRKRSCMELCSPRPRDPAVGPR
ncbi:hypothetical protein FGB62_8g415 [Gracilaria domingensis]|nr:hypothetical protein FGB62_8g415 [Gracilaria domingensis]